MLFMKFSTTLLSRYITLSDIHKASEHLTRSVCEVEEVISRRLPDLLVVGKVLSVEKHPDADKLVICQIDCGDHGQFQICTAATNVVADAFVPVALPGCHLSAIDLTISERKMRWVDSNGMICAKEELGIPEDTHIHGIWIMTDDLDIDASHIGQSLKTVCPWMQSDIIDVDNKTLTHRPDLTGHLWLARELYALSHVRDDLHYSFTSVPEYNQHINIQEILDHSTKHSLPVSVSTDKAYTYLTLSLTNISLAPSSFATRVSLYDLGYQTQNNRVDISNLFMASTDQPIHFFDADKISWGIHVRQAQAGETCILLNDKEVTLTPDDIVIADNEKILALAWVMGCASSAVSDTTTDIIAEIACFDPVAVRKTALRYDIRTEASLRFEKAPNPARALIALPQLLDMLKEYHLNYDMGGISSYISAYTQQHLVPKEITLQSDHQKAFLGKDVDAQTLLWLLGRRTTDHSCFVPLWRSFDDIDHRYDVYEEVARLHGFDNFDTIYPAPSRPTPKNPLTHTRRTLETSLVQDSNFVHEETYPRQASGPSFVLSNPPQPETPTLRQSMMQPLLEMIIKNKWLTQDKAIFDIGSTRHNTDSSGQYGPHGQEKHTLGMIIQTSLDKTWPQRAFVSLKKAIETCLARLTNASCDYSISTHTADMHPKQHAIIHVNGTTVGHIYTIHPLVHAQEKKDIAYAELDLATLQDLQTQQPAFLTLQDQIIWRDLNFVIASDQHFDTIQQALMSVEAVQEIVLFDIYEIDQDNTSYAVSFRILWDGSLTTQDINTIMDECIARAHDHGATLRK